MEDPVGIRTRARNLVAAIETTDRNLSGLKRDLAAIQNSCNHDWSPVKSDPIIREAYDIPGDPPGTMGVDWRGKPMCLGK